MLKPMLATMSTGKHPIAISRWWWCLCSMLSILLLLVLSSNVSLSFVNSFIININTHSVIVSSFVTTSTTKTMIIIKQQRKINSNRQRHKQHCVLALAYDSNENERHNVQQQQQQQQKNNTNNVIRNDIIRDNNGIRPSLHPITINIIVDILKRHRSVYSTSTLFSSSPLDIVMNISSIATDAVQKRQKSSTIDNMKLNIIEQQTIVGRVIGVIMRIQLLETLLIEKCINVSWIHKYNEYNTFGILSQEIIITNNDNDTTLSNNNSNINNTNITLLLNEKMYNDPLFILNRVECILALYINTIEIPQLLKQNSSFAIPDGSIIDFLDDDRKNVLLL